MAAIARTMALVQGAGNKDSKLSFCPLTSQLMLSIYQTHPASESGDGCVDAQKDRQGWDMDLEIAAHALVNEQVTEQLWFLLISPGVLLNLLPALGVGTKN